MLVDQPPNLEAVNGGVEERFVNERGEEASRIRVAIDEDLDSPPEQFQPKEPAVSPPNGAGERRVRIDALPPPRRALPTAAGRPGVPPECVRCAAYLENAEKAFALVQKANDMNRQYQEDQRKLGELERTLEDRLQHISLLTSQLKEAERKEAEHHQRTIESQTRIETLQEHLLQAREEAAENKAAAARSKASEEALARTTTHMQALETRVKEMAGRAISSGKALQKFLALVNSKEMRDLSTVGDNPTDAQRRQRAEIRQQLADIVEEAMPSTATTPPAGRKRSPRKNAAKKTPDASITADLLLSAMLDESDEEEDEAPAARKKPKRSVAAEAAAGFEPSDHEEDGEEAAEVPVEDVPDLPQFVAPSPPKRHARAPRAAGASAATSSGRQPPRAPAKRAQPPPTPATPAKPPAAAVNAEVAPAAPPTPTGRKRRATRTESTSTASESLSPVRTSRRIAHVPPPAQPPAEEVEDMPEEIAEAPPPKRRTRSSTSSVVRLKKTPEPRSPTKRAAASASTSAELLPSPPAAATTLEAEKEAEKTVDLKPAGRKREERAKDEEPKQEETKPAEEEPKEAPKEPKPSTGKSTANVRLRRGTLAAPSDEQEPKAASSTSKPKTSAAAAAQPKRAQLIEVANAPAFPTKRAVRGGRLETLRQPPPTPSKPNDARSRAKTAGASLNFVMDILAHLTQRGQKQPKEKAVADAAKRFDDQLARWAGGEAKLPTVQELVELLVRFIREQNVGDLWGQVRPQAEQSDPIMAATERSFFDFITAINQKGARWPGIFGALIDKLSIEYYMSKPSAVAQKCRDFRVMALALSLFEKEANEEDLKKRTDNVRLLVDTMLGQEDAQAAVRILTFLYTTHRRFLVDRVLATDDPIAPQRRQLIRWHLSGARHARTTFLAFVEHERDNADVHFEELQADVEPGDLAEWVEAADRVLEPPEGAPAVTAAHRRFVNKFKERLEAAS
ncbi:hypothetical protein M3Y99_00479600 [Aphelenchoides fujianensis]|nr:hypothetical protein M3Y99_00479600 [Aphelenchoides fujianensis]